MAGRRKVREAMVSCLSGRGIADPAEAATDVIAMTRGIVTTALAMGLTDFEAIRARIGRAALGYLRECPRNGADPGDDGQHSVGYQARFPGG